MTGIRPSEVINRARKTRKTRKSTGVNSNNQFPQTGKKESCYKAEGEAVLSKLHKPIFIHDKLFMENIWISYGVSPEDYLKAIKRYLPEGTKPEFKLEHLKAIGGNYTYYEKPNGEGLSWIWIREENDISSLAHEIFHTVYTILDIKGVRLCEASEEVFAYYIGMIMEEVLNKVGPDDKLTTTGVQIRPPLKQKAPIN